MATAFIERYHWPRFLSLHPHLPSIETLAHCHPLPIFACVEKVQDIFTIGRQLGAGQFGTTYLCTEKKTGLQYACKTIPKSKLLTEDDVEDVRREVAILYHVQVGVRRRAVEDVEVGLC